MRSISYTPPGATESITIYVKPQIRALNIGTQAGDSLHNPNQAQSDAAIESIFQEVETKLPHMEKAAAQLWTWASKLDESMLCSDNPSKFIDDSISDLNLTDQELGAPKESNALLRVYLSELKATPPASLKQALQRKALELRVTTRAF